MNVKTMKVRPINEERKNASLMSSASVAGAVVFGWLAEDRERESLATAFSKMSGA